MNRPLTTLLGAQFLTAFADNAILFAIIGLVLAQADSPTWYIPALQTVFLVSFVLFAPWVGPFAERYPKPRVLLIANIFKTLGATLILLNVEPLIAYALVGFGAAMYGPAKYGILPELVDHNHLIKANSLIEGSTIAAIILGTIIGGQLADYSIEWALIAIIASYLVSILISLFMPKLPSHNTPMRNALSQFVSNSRTFFHTPKVKFSLLGASLFWGSAAMLRVIIVAWAPLILLTQSTSDIAALTLYLAIGIILGSIIVPKLIPLEHLRRVRIAAIFMGLSIFLLSLFSEQILASAALVFIGFFGGIVIVPLNAQLQEAGYHSVGSGNAIATQNFAQNLAMLFMVGIYTLLSNFIDVTLIMSILGIFVVLATLAINRYLPDYAP